MIFLKLFLTFLKIGAFTFGGGYAMLPLIQEAILENAWLSEEDILNFIAVSESTPGPFAINAATYVGTEVGGVIGAVCATFGVVLPSFVVILTVAHFFEKFKSSKIVSGIMSGLKPAVIGLIFSALISMAKEVFFPLSLCQNFSGIEFYVSAFIFLLSLFLILKKKLHPIAIIGISALLGIISGFAVEFI